jgi:2-C-methyl-D-erythritol 2,4-cyclodiphosphate synthase
MRIGFGYDVHALVPDRLLILGGIRVPFELGLEGHSDADVIVHALCDALLGALALGDLGQHFPSSDERWRGVSSLVLLRHVVALLKEQHFMLGNADITVVAQRPRLAPYTPRMVETLATTVGCLPAQISLKATTTDGLGFIGQGTGIAAYAVCVICPIPAAADPYPQAPMVQ